MDSLFDYVGDAPFVLDARAEDAAQARFAQIADYYEARTLRLCRRIPPRPTIVR